MIHGTKPNGVPSTPGGVFPEVGDAHTIVSVTVDPFGTSVDLSGSEATT